MSANEEADAANAGPETNHYYQDHSSTGLSPLQATVQPLDPAPYFATDHPSEATEWADRISGDCDYGHRGAYPGDDYDIILYGRDGYHQDARTRREVEIILEALAGSGVDLELGLDTEDGYTWAILVRPAYPHNLHDLSEEALAARHEAMHDLVWWAWAVARGLADSEREYARKLALHAAERLIGGVA